MKGKIDRLKRGIKNPNNTIQRNKFNKLFVFLKIKLSMYVKLLFSESHELLKENLFNIEQLNILILLFIFIDSTDFS